ncbi:hypothetical protein STEG23_001940, partial [Scotinomys teguina]
IVRETPISGVRTFYTDANKQGKAGYKSEDLSKVVQSPYNSVQKSELYAILLVLMDFSEPLNIVTDSQYAERVVLHIETAEFIPDESELTSLFIQLQDIIRNRKHPLYITHIRSHTGLPGPLAQGNDEIDKLLIGNVLEASEFHKKHHVNSKGLKRDFSITWQQAKEIVRKCPTCSFYNQTPLPAGCNPKGTQRNDIWQMDVFHFAEFGKLKYVHHTIDTYSGFQWATALSSEKADSVITHLLEVMAIMGIPAQIKTDNAPAYVSGKMKQFFAYYNIKHITVFSFVYDYETCQLLAAPIYFREDMGIEEPADGVNFHSGKTEKQTPVMPQLHTAASGLTSFLTLLFHMTWSLSPHLGWKTSSPPGILQAFADWDYSGVQPCGMSSHQILSLPSVQPLLEYAAISDDSSMCQVDKECNDHISTLLSEVFSLLPLLKHVLFRSIPDTCFTVPRILYGSLFTWKHLP